MSDPAPLTTRLNELRAALAGVAPAGSLATVEAATKALLAQGGESPVTVAGLLAGLRGPTPSTLADLKAELALVKANTAALEAKLVLVGDYTYNTFLATEKVLSVTGDEETDLDNQWTTRGGLWQIYQLLSVLSSQVRSITHGLVLDETLVGDLPSTGSLVGDGYRYAVWGTLPNYVTSNPEKTLLYNNNWTGYSMLIQTTDPAPSNGAEVVTPGAWWPLSGDGTRFARVSAQYPITAYIRADNVVPTEPVVLWTGTAAVPADSANIPGAELYYFVEEIPMWADRLRINITTTNGYGNRQFFYPDYSIALSSAGGSYNNTMTIPAGSRYYGVNAGGSTQRCTGIVYALAPGVTPP